MKIHDARITPDGNLELLVSYFQRVRTQTTVSIPTREKLLSHTTDETAKEKLSSQTDEEYYRDAIAALPAAFEEQPDASSSSHPGLQLAQAMIGREVGK